MPAEPFFFTSYAVRRSDRDLVAEFHTRLEDEVGIKRSAAQAHRGFLDRSSLGLGVGWQAELVSALCGTRLLIALLCDDFFEREWCGREWAVMLERQRRATPPGEQPPPVILPLFWVPPSGSLPQVVQDIQYRSDLLGPAYAGSCVVDLLRGDSKEFHDFIVRLTALMMAAAATPIPAMEPEDALRIPSAFGSPRAGISVAAAPVVSVAPAGLGGPAADREVAHRGGGLTSTDRRVLINTLVESSVCANPAAYNVWIEAIRQEIRPVELDVAFEGDIRVRVASLVTFALGRERPDVLLALANCLADLSANQNEPGSHATRVRKLVDDALGGWPNHRLRA